jgi:transcriptional regulator with XRE-family HTH domain
MNLQEKIGLRIAELRKERNITQQQLAYDANIERTYLAHVEKGRKNITVTSLDKFFKTFEINPSEFFNSEIFFK